MATRPARARTSAAHNGSTEAAAGVQSAVRVEPAANDDTAKTAFSINGDPLFGMAIASAILFAVLAALVAMS
jgi:hypothetical protein